MSLKLEIHPYRLQLKEPFVLSYGTFHHRDTLILKLTDDQGFTGYGEATAISYYDLHIDDMIAQLNLRTKDIEALTLDHPEKIAKEWVRLFPEQSFLQSALDCASWDLYACRQNVPLRHLLSKESITPMSSFTISGSAQSIQQKLDQLNWPILKIKMGTNEDFDILDVLKRYKGTAELRIDANGGWDVDQALHLGHQLSAMGIKWIEQPLPKGQESKMIALRDLPNIEWWADESVTHPDSIDLCEDGFDGLNFKLMKSGGITPTLKMIEYAKSKGLKVALGCMTESSFGISALAQMAALAEAIDMDGNLLISNDPGEGVSLEKGHISFAERCGIGCQWNKNNSKLNE